MLFSLVYSYFALNSFSIGENVAITHQDIAYRIAHAKTVYM